MGARENIERLLEIAIIGERPAKAGKQRLVAGMSDAGLSEHGHRLGALPGGAQRLAVSKGCLGVLGVGTIALAVDFYRVPRIAAGAGFGLRRQRSRDVGHGLA